VKQPSEAALRVLHDWPTDDDWITESQLAERLPDAHEVSWAPHEGWLLGERPLDSVLSEIRRRGWLIRDRRGDAPRFKRTPTGRTHGDHDEPVLSL
jgi:hypothetical protein